MLDKFVEKRVAKKAEEARKRNMEFAKFVYQLLGRVSNYQTTRGTFKLQRKDFPILGKKEVPCTYSVSEYAVDLELDYSSRIKLFPKMFEVFDSAKVDQCVVGKILEKRGIEFFRDCDHPEYDIDDNPYYCKDKLLVSTTLDNARTIARRLR